jgi:hypothetical protein
MKRILLSTILAASFAIAALPSGAHAGQPPPPGACSISPNPSSLSAAYTISATGLPTIDPTYLIVYPPTGGGHYYGQYPLLVNSGGSWSGNDSANQTGTWTYVFSGLLVNKRYGTVATCSVQVS